MTEYDTNIEMLAHSEISDSDFVDIVIAGFRTYDELDDLKVANSLYMRIDHLFDALANQGFVSLTQTTKLCGD